VERVWSCGESMVLWREYDPVEIVWSCGESMVLFMLVQRTKRNRLQSKWKLN
jgi:hypothetical protein